MNNKNKAKKPAYNRTVCASPPVGGLGSVKSQSAQAPLWDFTPPQFCGCWNASRSFIATAKPSHTAGTLCAMTAGIINSHHTEVVYFYIVQLVQCFPFQEFYYKIWLIVLKGFHLILPMLEYFHF